MSFVNVSYICSTSVIAWKLAFHFCITNFNIFWFISLILLYELALKSIYYNTKKSLFYFGFISMTDQLCFVWCLLVHFILRQTMGYMCWPICFNGLSKKVKKPCHTVFYFFEKKVGTTMLSDSFWCRRRKNGKKKFLRTDFSSRHSWEQKWLGEQRLWIPMDNTNAQSIGYEWSQVTVFYHICLLIFIQLYGETHLLVLEIVCNWELWYLAIQWREEASTDKKFLIIFLSSLKVKAACNFPAQLQSSGAALLDLV